MSCFSCTPARHGAALGLFALAAVLAGCSRPPAQEEPVRAVKLLTVAATPLVSAPEYAGEVRARVESRLGFRVGGKVLRRQAELGQRVRAGQVLAELDPRDLRLSVEAAQAQAAAARTQRDLAEADLARYRELRARNFISAAEMERREASFKSAQAQFDQARAQAGVQGNQAAYAVLAADAAGVVTGVDAEPGQVVAAGTPVVRVAVDGPRDVVFAVPEDRVALVRLGSTVSVRGWGADAGQPIEGRVREVAASADPVTRTYTVKVAVDAADAPALGATVYARPSALSQAGTPVIKLPTSALRQEGQGSAVWVLDPASMTVRSQPVQIATADGNEAVIASGLAPGMQVVTAGVHVLAPGQKVSAYRDRYAPAAGAAPAPAAAASGGAR
ncbi:efflux RND transporter periplasmic adaptor subunit [Pseudacidovorax intermedius]|uniref:RND transporter n=1 Tax=Pseudacidovorax intermedius TaxID=433924 RepID=A0A147GX26_9BURK|nr:efflux RND transporter periplasmic adaptor subunit [Pseudacidovorax intermedius]KTT22190.1 RND transporter [Pseudacidovorax intermedius]